MATSLLALANALLGVLLSIGLLCVSANARTARPITATAIALFSEFDSDPVNFPASPKMYIEQVLADPSALVIQVSYSDTEQELKGYNISYHLLAEKEREQLLPVANTNLPSQFSLQNLLPESQYNICVRASFKPGDFALYTMQVEKVRNCTVLSTVGKSAERSNTALTVVVIVVVYFFGALVAGFAVHKLRKRYCKDQCKCTRVQALAAAWITALRRKWMLVQNYVESLRAARSQAGPDGASQSQLQLQSQQQQVSRNAIEVASSYTAVAQNEDGNKRALAKNHSNESVDKCDPAESNLRSTNCLSQPSLNELDDAELAKNAPCKTIRSECKSEDPGSDFSDSFVRQGSRKSAKLSSPVHVDVHAPTQRSVKRSRSPHESASSCANEPTRKSNGSSDEHRSSRRAHAPKLIIQNATPLKNSCAKDSPTPSPQSPQTAAAASVSDLRTHRRHANANANDELDGKLDDKHQCPQHGSVVLTINPDTVAMSNKKRKRKERSEVELHSPQDERQQFVNSVYDSLNARTRGGSPRPSDDNAERDNDRERSRTRRNTTGRKPPTPTATEAAQRNREAEPGKVGYRKQRISVPVMGDSAAELPANNVQHSREDEPTMHSSTHASGSRRRTDAWKRGADEPTSVSAESANRQRKLRVPADSVENDQTDDEVWILRASKV